MQAVKCRQPQMKIILASIHASASSSRTKSAPAEALLQDYSTRIARYTPCEAQRFPTEDALFQWVDRQQARTPLHIILLDSRGKQFTSEQFAAHLGQLRDRGLQQVLFAIGPADGWSQSSRDRASLLLSLGLITLPHELARVILAEQIYRALSILAGHPYHSGH